MCESRHQTRPNSTWLFACGNSAKMAPKMPNQRPDPAENCESKPILLQSAAPLLEVFHPTPAVLPASPKHKTVCMIQDHYSHQQLTRSVANGKASSFFFHSRDCKTSNINADSFIRKQTLMIITRVGSAAMWLTCGEAVYPNRQFVPPDPQLLCLVTHHRTSARLFLPSLLSLPYASCQVQAH